MGVGFLSGRKPSGGFELGGDMFLLTFLKIILAAVLEIDWREGGRQSIGRPARGCSVVQMGPCGACRRAGLGPHW